MLVLIIAILFVITYFLYSKVFEYKRKPFDIEKIEEGGFLYAYKDEIIAEAKTLEAMEPERVYAVANDRIKLSAQYFHVADGAPIHIYAHGWRGSALHDCGLMTRIAREMGHNFLMIDHRACGKSGGTSITFGIKEREDIWEWAHYLAQRFGEDTPIILHGISMGGASVLMASELDLPSSVKAIISDCAYSSPYEILMLEAKRHHIPRWFASIFMQLGTVVIGRFSINRADPVSAVANTDIPIALIHGGDDTFVPLEMGQEIYASLEANDQIPADYKAMLVVPGAKHAVSVYVDWEGYKSFVMNFVSKALAK